MEKFRQKDQEAVAGINEVLKRNNEQPQHEDAEQKEEAENDIIEEVNEAIDKEEEYRAQNKPEVEEEKIDEQPKVEQTESAPKTTVDTNVQPESEPKTTTTPNTQPKNEMEDIYSHSDPSKIPTLSKEATLEIIIGRKVTFRDGKNENAIRLKKLLDYDKNSLLNVIEGTFRPSKLPKSMVEKLNTTDPVLLQTILEYSRLEQSELQKVLLGIINKDKDALKNILKIRYDKDDLSKQAFWPWIRKQRNMMSKFADDNKEIAEVVGEYEPNFFKRMMKMRNTKALPKGNVETQSKGKNKIREKIKSWVLTPEELARANSKSENQTENTKSNTQRENDNESR